MMRKFSSAIAFVLAVVFVSWGASAQAADKIDFAKQILPILKDSCFKCHGPKKQKADLRLDVPKAIMEGSDEGEVVIPGKAAESTLYTRVILPPDDDDIMPPQGDPLTKEQANLIRDWINQNAEFGDWTGKPKKTKPPELITTLEAPPADPKALDRLERLGALAMPIAADTNLIVVDFRGVAGNEKIDEVLDTHLEPVGQQLTWLSLANTKVSDAGLAPLAGLPNLTRLHLEKTGIGDAGLVYLKSLKNLQYLNLYSTKVTDAGLAHLKGLKNIEKLFLWRTKVTAAGAETLKEALPGVYVNRGWDGPAATRPAEAGAKDAAKPINAKCPVTDKPICPDFTCTYKGQVIAFCCAGCREKFVAKPTQFIAKLKEFKAAD